MPELTVLGPLTNPELLFRNGAIQLQINKDLI